MKSGLKFSYIITAMLLSTLLTACNETESKLWQGYVEGEFVYVSSPLSGQLDEVSVRKGQTVAAGQPLFTLERKFEEAGIEEAEGKLDQAISDLADKRKGRRPSEIASVRARLRKAEAAEKLAATEYKRRAELYNSKTISEEERDQARTDYEQAIHLVKEIKSELKTATLGSRSDEINAAESAVKAAQAKLEQARWNYDQKAQSAPRAGLIFDTIRYKGEWIAAGKPVLSILPPENRKIRFYVPEQIVGEFKIGEKMLINFDGLKQPIPATLNYISAQAEYTPPVIYSSQSRAKLVFMLEAIPAANKDLLCKPGQPVDVSRTINGFNIENRFFARIKNYFRSSDE